MNDPKVFIRPVGRIADVRDDAQMLKFLMADSDLSGDHHFMVPVLPTDTVEDVRKTLRTMISVQAEASSARGAAGFPISATDHEWIEAVSQIGSDKDDTAIFDAEALPYDSDRAQCPTNIVFQAFDVSNEATALDLYMELLSRAERGEEWDWKQAPSTFLDDTCIRFPDGAYYSRQEAAEDDGRDASEGVLMSFRQVFGMNAQRYKI